MLSESRVGVNRKGTQKILPRINVVLFLPFSVKFFSITDRGVGTVSAVKIRLTQEGIWRDYWYLEQVSELEFTSTDR